MKCTNCGNPMEVHLNEERGEGAEYEELEFSCPECGHEFFVRVKEDDLVEVR